MSSGDTMKAVNGSLSSQQIEVLSSDSFRGQILVRSEIDSWGRGVVWRERVRMN